MIIGIGNDIVDIPRIEKALARFGDRFINRVYTATEIKRAELKKKAGYKVYSSTFAKRFAAKEAFAKALGTGFSNGVFMRDIGVVNLPGGKPGIHLTGGAALLLQKIIPEGRKAQIDVSLSDDYPNAIATVIISAS
jgi:holo-[acyl-carrier protein] synthase